MNMNNDKHQQGIFTIDRLKSTSSERMENSANSPVRSTVSVTPPSALSWFVETKIMSTFVSLTFSYSKPEFLPECVAAEATAGRFSILRRSKPLVNGDGDLVMVMVIWLLK